MDQPPFADFAAFLKKLRDDRGLTQADIARTLEVAPSQPSGWLSGRSRPRPENLERLAEIYGLDLDKLLTMCRYRTRDTAGAVDPDETEVLALYRQLADEHRPTVKSILYGLTRTRGRRRVTEPTDTLGRDNDDRSQQNPRRKSYYKRDGVQSMKLRFGFQPAY